MNKYFSNSQRGYSLIVMVLFLVAVAGFVGAAAYIFINSTLVQLHLTRAIKADYIARAGLEMAKTKLYGGSAAVRKSCITLNSDNSLTDVSLGDGQFSVTAAQIDATTFTLTGSTTASATMIPITSTLGTTLADFLAAGYGYTGEVAVNSEIMRYQGFSTSNTVCSGQAPCLYGVTRGVNSTATAHAAGSMMEERYCQVRSEAAVPGFADPKAKSAIRVDIMGLQDGWVVGTYTNNENMYRVIGYGLADENPISTVNLNAIKMSSASGGWVVGDALTPGSQSAIFSWNGFTATSQVVANDSGQTLNAIDCATENDCWAVGNNRSFIHYNGSNWTQQTGLSIPNVNYHSVSCPSTNFCMAVGASAGTTPSLVKWDGSSWQAAAQSGAQNATYYAVKCLSSNFCLAVGSNKATIIWNGSVWTSAEQGIPSTTYYGLACSSTNDCWAVGRSRNFIRWNGIRWDNPSSFTSTVVNADYYDITCPSSNQCWAVGNSNAVAYWNGVRWTGLLAGNNLPLINLRSIAVPFALSPILFNWQEVEDN